jgi:hypothetical protein
MTAFEVVKLVFNFSVTGHSNSVCHAYCSPLHVVMLFVNVKSNGTVTHSMLCDRNFFPYNKHSTKAFEIHCVFTVFHHIIHTFIFHYEMNPTIAPLIPTVPSQNAANLGPTKL